MKPDSVFVVCRSFGNDLPSMNILFLYVLVDFKSMVFTR